LIAATDKEVTVIESTERNRKISSYLGFAVKSGAVVFGLDGIKNGGPAIALILADNALSDKSKKEITFLSGKKNTPAFFVDNLPDIVKKENVKVVSVKNKNLAIQIMEGLKASGGQE